jgi:hypothetical protein
MASTARDTQAAALIARLKTMVNNDLKKICKEEGKVQSGNKANLQSRVIDRTLHLLSLFVSLPPLTTSFGLSLTALTCSYKRCCRPPRRRSPAAARTSHPQQGRGSPSTRKRRSEDRHVRHSQFADRFGNRILRDAARIWKQLPSVCAATRQTKYVTCRSI